MKSSSWQFLEIYLHKTRETFPKVLFGGVSQLHNFYYDYCRRPSLMPILFLLLLVFFFVLSLTSRRTLPGRSSMSLLEDLMTISGLVHHYILFPFIIIVPRSDTQRFRKKRQPTWLEKNACSWIYGFPV